MRSQCNVCGGIYYDLSADGVPYFHACPPLTADEVRALIAANQSPLTKTQADQLAFFDQADPPKNHPKETPSAGDTYLSSLALARPGARDEAIDPKKVADVRRKHNGTIPDATPAEQLMKAAGAGATKVDDATL